MIVPGVVVRQSRSNVCSIVAGEIVSGSKTTIKLLMPGTASLTPGSISIALATAQIRLWINGSNVVFAASNRRPPAPAMLKRGEAFLLVDFWLLAAALGPGSTLRNDVI